MHEHEFESFGKIPRLYRDIVITEKLDGTNAQILVTPDGEVHAASRNRWITPEKDNYGFARWVEENKEDLVRLGPGRHFGEWWGAGIQRRYDKNCKTFSLFNVHKFGQNRPECCEVVPVLYDGPFSQDAIDACIQRLRNGGSAAAPGFKYPEGIIVWHSHSRQYFKITCEDDQTHKGKAA